MTMETPYQCFFCHLAAQILPTWWHPLHPQHLRGKGQAHHSEAHGGDGVAQLLGRLGFLGVPLVFDTEMEGSQVMVVPQKRWMV